MRVASTPKISFGMIVLNGEPFIKYNLENLYPHAHEILVVEGAVEKFAHAATPDGHSLDNTVEIVRNFPDPEGKIKLIQCEGFWPEKDEMANAYMEACTGDYIWQVDVDEFYKPKDIEYIRELLANDSEISQVNIRSIGFWRSFNARMMGASYIFGADEFIRIFRFKKGYRYATHRPPTLADDLGNLYKHKKVILAKELEQMGIVMYHYSYVFPEYVAGKSIYYAQMGWGQGHEDGVCWYSREWQQLSNPLRVHIIKYPPSWLIPFTGKHPSVISQMCQDINYKENILMNSFLEEDYQKYKKAGETLASIILQTGNDKLPFKKAIRGILGAIFFPKSKRDLQALLTIFSTIKRLVCNHSKCG